MTNIHKLKIEPMTPETFAPFGEMMEAKDCMASEEEIIAVLTDEGVDSWTRNIMIANAGESGTFSHDRESGTYTLHKTEKCT